MQVCHRSTTSTKSIKIQDSGKNSSLRKEITKSKYLGTKLIFLQHDDAYDNIEFANIEICT